MGKIIDIDDLKFTNQEIISCNGNYKQFTKMLLEKIENAPDKRSTPIIHCKNCKYYKLEKMYIIQGIPCFGYEVCTRWGVEGCHTAPNGYCFLAERKEEKNETD